ncbi:MAG: XRE family transcriptional regulator [Desulfovibrio sp.]|nr:XRE family transcriptional regulator [Desulfovibrio sp.]
MEEKATENFFSKKNLEVKREMRQATRDRLTRLNNKRRIQEYLDIAGETQASLAAKIGVSPQLVNSILNGRGGNRRVIAALQLIGVPEKFLFAPRRQEAA